ncbi:Glycosyl transferase, family 1 [uncultured Caudovirales phage]|uniref:Glycosyl transferase, family 1 n=1 Tax=uncultured Caudovirales phage TaxID=2100421 RepID=A0A6J5N5Z0_9CAUD|nr:Glycosyl transferase, family 1 [uncultured Caudovirales phage]
MPTNKEKLTGAVSVWSNSYNAPTGYGQQVRMLVDRLKRASLDVAMLSNYGLEGIPSTINTPYGKVPHYPRGIDQYSNDSGPQDHKTFIADKDKPNLFISLYDVWVMKSKQYDDFPVAAWVPLDHVTLPPGVEKFLRKENVTPVAMSPHGVRQLTAKGIECEYAAHAIDIKTYKPTYKIGKHEINEYLGLTPENFMVGVVAANKAGGLVHRKAYGELILAFSIFAKDKPDAVLYLHTDGFGLAGGWNLLNILASLGVKKEQVIFPNPQDYRFGLAQTDLAALYTRMDVLLAPSLGEGFGVPAVEAQACGTRVIGSNWAATPDLISPDSWLTDGQLSWDAGQDAWWMTPNVSSLVNALEESYKAERGPSQVAIDFASQFEVEKVWDESWIPILKKLL